MKLTLSDLVGFCWGDEILPRESKVVQESFLEKSEKTKTVILKVWDLFPQQFQSVDYLVQWSA